MRLLPFALALALACASTPKVTRSELMRQISRDYPSADFIVGTATGANAEEAEKNAIVNCAGGVSSTIDASLSSVSEERTYNGSRSASNAVKSKVDEKIKTDAAALIRPLRELTTHTDMGWVAVAVLDRRELESKYRAESDTVVTRLESLWRRILADPNATTIGEALCEAEQLEPQLDDKAVERTVTTRTQALGDEQKKLRADVQRVRETRRQGNIVVIARTPSQEANTTVADLLAGELQRRGVTTRLSENATCDAVASGILVRVDSTPSCSKNGFGGNVCEVNFRTTAKSCVDGSTVLEQPSSNGRGSHASREDLALKAAYGTISSTEYVKTAATRIGSALGFGCRGK